MKKFFQLTKVGNSLFATLSSSLVKQLNLKHGDQVFYEIIPGKRKIIMNIVPRGTKPSEKIVETLSKNDKKWLEENAGSLTVKK